MRLAFGDCRLDLEKRELRRSNRPVHVRAKVYEVLRYLVLNRDRLITREELLAHAWPNINVSDATLSSCIRSVRQAIGDESRKPKFVRTLRGQGFRFIAKVTETPETTDALERSANNNSQGQENGLSIAVLPFTNQNRDPRFDYLSDGLAEDVTTALSHFKAFTVIAQSSSFQFRRSEKSPAEIGEELDVSYVLDGNIRCNGSHYRASTHLTHVPTRQHIWAGRYDGEVDTLFSVQDDITKMIATNIKPEIDLAEIRRAAARAASGSLDAQETAWRARALLDRARTERKPELHTEGVALAEQAAELDPNCRQAWWTISFGNFLSAFARQGNDPEAYLRRSREAAEKLRALDRNDHSAYMSLGWISYIERDFERAMTNLQYAYDLNPNCTMTLMLMGVILTATGKPERGNEHLSRALRLSPRDLWLGFMLAARAFAYYAMGRYADGVEYVKRAIEREPVAPANHVILAACLAEIGDMEGAAEAVRKQREISATYLEEYLSRKRLPFQEPNLAERYAAALARAAAAEAKR